RIIKFTLIALIKSNDVHDELREKLRDLIVRLHHIPLQRVSRSDFFRRNRSRNNLPYDLVLKVCELAYNELFPTRGVGQTVFGDLLDNETRMSSVFEEFVRVFYQTEVPGFVGASRED